MLRTRRAGVGTTLTIAVVIGMAFASIVQSQTGASVDAYMRGLDLEQRERYRDAAVAFREALAKSPASLPAVLGLERVYAQLGWTDSMVPVLETAIARQPRERAFRVAQLRTFQTLGDGMRMRHAFERWTHDWPRDPVPHREFARLLIQEGQTAAADTILRRAQAELGTGRGLETEVAQLRAAMGLWELSAESWRGALSSAGHMEQAAIFSLFPTPEANRPGIRRTLLLPPVDAAARRLLAALELFWGAPRNAWLALRDLPLGTSTIAAWMDFARRAEEAEAWLAARDALVAVHDAERRPEIAARAASDALAGGDAAGAAELAVVASAGMDSALAAVSTVPLHVRALSELGRAEAAERVVAAYDAFQRSEQRARLNQVLAWAWVRVGNTARAKELMRSAAITVGGQPAGSGGSNGEEPAGWLALYEGDLSTARKKLRLSALASPDLIAALAVLGRTKADSSIQVGRAFLEIAQGDTLSAAAAFEAAARGLLDASTLLLASAARLHTARRDDAHSIPLWSEIANGDDSPEAPEANLEWARALRRAGKVEAAIERLEFLILTYPQSALVPQARRELELARATIPSAS